VRTRRATQHARTLDAVADVLLRTKAKGITRLRVEDQSPTGESITIDGRKLLNFGSCAYLGLNVDPRVKAGAIAAVEQYGPIFSSSTAYTSVDLYTELEVKLQRIFGGTVIVPATTTLGHFAVLPVVVSPDDIVLLDRQVHASVQMAAQVVKSTGTTVTTVPHNDVAALEERIVDAAKRYDKVWYMTDGVYSMYGNTAPVRSIAALLDAHEQLHIYFDDAHGVGWKGEHGRGHVLTDMELHPRMILSASLGKSWGTGGAVVVFSDPELAERVQLTGPTLIFSGPVHPAHLGAAVAATDIHLSPELDDRQRRLAAQMELVRERLVEMQLPAQSLELTPLWYIRIGSLEGAMEVVSRLMADGFYANVAAFPAVPIGGDGLRFTQTLYHSDEDLEAFLQALGRHVPEFVQWPDHPVDLR
jgi:7-keto-8-aminopelargonate synthetase-like enzyme